MDYQINKHGGSFSFLRTFLYEAIFIPDGVQKPPKSITDKPELKLYIEDFGKKDDWCLTACRDNEIIGAVWARIMNDYGHIDEKTPSLAISVLEPYRNKGIGTALITEMINLLRDNGYKYVSLSVQKENAAADLYRRLGFEVIAENCEEWIMRRKLN